MLSIVYASTAAEPFSAEALAALLEQSRANNTRLGLTGLLLYKDGQFMQALEGPDDVVRERIAVIAADNRHGNIRTVLEREIADREFPDWTMGYRTVTDATLRDVPGYNDVFQSGDSQTAQWMNPSKARLLLEWFRTHWM